MNYVVGSGPSGVSCAKALLDRGLEVTLLDYGELKTEIREEDRRDFDFTRSKVPLKLAFGSDFPYRFAEEKMGLVRNSVELFPSLAKGGLSNVWGASVLPYSRADFADWPVKAEDLAPHYAAVSELLNVSSAHDDLEKIFPSYRPISRPLKVNQQGRALLTDLERHRAALAASGIVFGQARIAASSAGEASCIYCGQCMTGCPDGVIYNSTNTLSALLKRPGFHYRSGVYVEKLKEEPHGVRISAKTREGSSLELEASSVFLAAGVFGTSKILLSTLELWDTPTLLKDSQYFLFPFLRYAGVGGPVKVNQEPLYNLSQIFMEILDPRISKNGIHLQIYGYIDFYEKAVRGLFGPAFPMIRPLFGALISRLLIFQGFLHSDSSSSASLRLTRRGGKEQMVVDAQPNPETEKIIRRLLHKLLSHRRSLGGLALRPLLKIANVGRGFHSGGTFPMRAKPSSPFETDILGRPRGSRRIHAVDSTVFPTIPATTITFSVMANAHRIGTLADCR